MDSVWPLQFWKVIEDILEAVGDQVDIIENKKRLGG